VKQFLDLLLPFQRFFIPALITFFLWATWRVVCRKDLAVGLAFYLALVILVDGYMNTGIFLPGLEKGSIRYSEVCAAFALFSRPESAPRHWTYRAVTALVTLYFGLLLLSAFRSEPAIAGVFEFRRLIIPQIIAFVIARRGLHSPDDFRRFAFVLSAFTLWLALFTFWDLFFDRWIIKSDMLAKAEYIVNRKHGRYGSLFLNPNYLGAFVVLTFPAFFVWMLTEKITRAKVFACVGLLSSLFCLVETQSRGPLLAFGLSLGLLVLGPAGGVSRRRRVSMFLLFALGFTLLMPGFLIHAAERFGEIDREMTTEKRSRQTMWLFTQRLIADYPFGGIGFGEQQFLKAMDEYGFEQEYGEVSLDNPHNSYLQMTVYAGIPVLIAFAGANVVLLISAARSLIRRNIPGSPSHIVFALATGVAGFLMVIYPDMHMFTQNVAPVYWVIFGLTLAECTRSSAPACRRPRLGHSMPHRAVVAGSGRHIGLDGRPVQPPPYARRAYLV
jgi:hypothetical protein